MDDLIDRKAILKHIEKIRQGVQTMDDIRRASIIMNGMALCEEAVMKQPSAQPVKHGRWIERESGIEDKENGFETVIVCSCCDFPATTFYSEDCESRTQIRTDFCPNCGARMDGKA